MDEIGITRASHTICDIDFFRSVGTPVKRLLEASGLPESIEEFPNEYVSIERSLEFRRLCLQTEKIDNIGLVLINNGYAPKLGSWFWSKYSSCVTLFDVLKIYTEALNYEANTIVSSIDFFSKDCEVSFRSRIPEVQNNHTVSGWQRLHTIVEVFRDVLGKNWAPNIIGFDGPDSMGAPAADLYPGSTVYTNKQKTSIRFPTRLLASVVSKYDWARNTDEVGESTISPQWIEDKTNNIYDANVVANLMLLLPPYLATSRPSLANMSELLGASERTLRRVLARQGLTYTKLVDTCRFELSKKLLENPDIKIIDASFAAGFDDPAHFSRAFRRHVGMAPRQYRKRLFALETN